MIKGEAPTWQEINEAIGQKIDSSGSLLMSPVAQESLYPVITVGLFGEIDAVAAKTLQKGNPERMFEHNTRRISIVDRGPDGDDYFSASINAFEEPLPVQVNGTLVGDANSILTMHTRLNEIWFYRLNTGQTVVWNPDLDGTQALLDTPESLFEPLPAPNVIPNGNPVRWLVDLENRNALEKMQQNLDIIK